MLRAIVIDARLREHHNVHILQSILMATCATPYPFPISKTNDTQYLIVLPPGINREAFLADHATNLKETGYVSFPWSASVNGTPLQMTYKVWVELKGMSPCSWTVQHLLHAAGSFGIVLEHALMENRASLERMRAVVAVPNLELVPKYAGVWVRGIMRKVLVTVHAWIEESVPNSAPPNEFFEQVKHRFSPLPPIPTEQALNQERDALTVDFDTLFSIWPTLDNGTEKSKIEGILQKSPLFAARLGAAAVASTTKNLNTCMLQSKESGELEGNSSKENGQDQVNEMGHINNIYCGTDTAQHATRKNIIQDTVQTAITLTPHSGTPSQPPLTLAAGEGLITSEDVDSAGAQILKAILSGPSKAQFELDQTKGQTNQLNPQNINLCSPSPTSKKQLSLTGGVSLPANVHPQIAANFAANLGPHRRCLQPYLTLPPTPLSHPWIYTQEEIDAYRAKLVRSATESDEVPHSQENNRGTEHLTTEASRNQN